MNARDYLPDLIRFEGAVPWQYLDTAGLVTVGIGNLLKTPEAATALPFLNQAANRLATPQEIERRWRAVGAMEPSKPAGYYRMRSPEIELDMTAVENLAIARLETEFLPALRRRFAGFDGFPDPAQAAILDMAFNLGMGNPQAEKLRGLAAYRKFQAAVDRRDWLGAAAECGRGGRPERTAWTRGKFEEAARIA